MTQVFIDALATACLYVLIGVSFWLVFAPTKTFYISHAAAISLGAYTCYWLSHNANIPISAGLVLASLLVALIAIAARRALVRGFGDVKGWLGLVISIGLYVICQNAISMAFGDETLALRTGGARVGYPLGDAYLTHTQALSMIVGTGFFVGISMLLATTKLGRAIRGIASNPDLCVVFGIEPNRIIYWTIGIGSGLGAVGGILAGLDSDLTPTMGFGLLMNGVVVMILGGVRSINGFPLAALLLATAQHFAAYYVDAKWMDAIAYFILIIFLMWKPHGFSAQRLRKVEV